MNFNPDDFPGKFAMLVRAEEEYFVLAKALGEAGRRWRDGCRYETHTPRHFPRHIFFNEGAHDYSGWCEKNCYIALEMGDFEW